MTTPIHSPVNMFSSARRRCFSAVNNPQPTEISIPSFLLPAFQPSSQRTSSFSTSASCCSKIGGAPLSVPQDVSFRILAPPQQKSGARVSRTQTGSTVEIEGPLGKMSLAIPAYMTIHTDEAKRAYTLSVLDQEVRKQREMWGAYCYLTNQVFRKGINTLQEPYAHICKTISLASVKAILLFFVSSVSDTAPQLRNPPSQSPSNIPVNNSYHSRSATHIQSSWEYPKVSRLAHLSQHASYYKVARRRSSCNSPPRFDNGGSLSLTRERASSSTARPSG